MMIIEEIIKEMMIIEEIIKGMIEEMKEEMMKEDKIENTNNQEEDKKDGEGEWEEVKKGGKRMKQVNTISNFKTSVLGTVFEGIIKQDIQEKGNSLSKCQIEPFFVLSLNLDGSSVDGVFQEYFSKKKIEGSSNNGSNDK